MRPTDWAAKSHDVSADGLTYTFHLYPDLRWSDGAPITAQTFAYSVNRALDPCTGSDEASYLYGLKGAEVFSKATCPPGARVSATSLVGASILTPNPQTLVLHLERPAASFLAALTYPTSWGVPQWLVEQYGDHWTFHLTDHGGLGGNLYKFTAWRHCEYEPTPTIPPSTLPGSITVFPPQWQDVGALSGAQMSDDAPAPPAGFYRLFTKNGPHRATEDVRCACRYRVCRVLVQCQLWREAECSPLVNLGPWRQRRAGVGGR